MHSLLRRVKKLEEASTTIETVNIYVFQPKDRVVYRMDNKEKIYMDWDEVISHEYSLAETLVAFPNHDNPNWVEELDGEWHVCVRGEAVINESC